MWKDRKSIHLRKIKTGLPNQTARAVISVCRNENRFRPGNRPGLGFLRSDTTWPSEPRRTDSSSLSIVSFYAYRLVIALLMPFPLYVETQSSEGTKLDNESKVSHLWTIIGQWCPESWVLNGKSDIWAVYQKVLDWIQSELFHCETWPASINDHRRNK